MFSGSVVRCWVLGCCVGCWVRWSDGSAVGLGVGLGVAWLGVSVFGWLVDSVLFGGVLGWVVGWLGSFIVLISSSKFSVFDLFLVFSFLVCVGSSVVLGCVGWFVWVVWLGGWVGAVGWVGWVGWAVVSGGLVAC